MLAARITAALIFVMVQGSGAMAPGAACWDERLSHEGKNSSCVGEFDNFTVQTDNPSVNHWIFCVNYWMSLSS